MFTVYILFSVQLQKHYVGYTSNDVKQRLQEHKGFAAKAKDWNIVFQKDFTSKFEAILLEIKIKKRGAKRYMNDITSR